MKTKVCRTKATRDKATKKGSRKNFFGGPAFFESTSTSHLSAGDLSFFSASMKYNFNNTHIHTNEKAALSAEAVNAKAFTYNNHIFFNKSEYSPHTNTGRKLLAHELAHVKQNRPVVARKPKETAPPQAPQKVGDEAAKKKAAQEQSGSLQVWKDLKEFFPGEGRKVAGTGNDDSIEYLTTSFKEGDEKEGDIVVHNSAPSIRAGKKYATEADAAKRKALLKAELDKIDVWRFDTYRIDDGDVSNSTITAKISGLNLTKKQEYITQLEGKSKLIANAAMQEYIRKQMPSTPVSAGAVPTANGGFEFQFDNITIKVLPDEFNSSEADENGGVTNFKPESAITYPGTPAWKSAGGKVTEITDPPKKMFQVWLVQTLYGPSADPAGTSGYGYGTTDEHKTAGTTSLRFHEGSHGSTFIEYIRDNISKNPYPEYNGAVGDTEAEINKKHREFSAKRDAFKKMVDEANKIAVEQIDCAGKTIVQYHKEHGGSTKVKCK